MTLISCPIHILVASFFSKILLVKNIDRTAGNIDESIKDAKEGKSQKKAQGAPKFSHLQVKVHTGGVHVHHSDHQLKHYLHSPSVVLVQSVL